jgi:hypothetical protein
MINITDLTGHNYTLQQLGINVAYENINQPINLVVTQVAMTWGMSIFFAYCIFICGIVFHELGHYLWLRRFRPDTKIYFYFEGYMPQIHTGTQEDYDALTSRDKINVYLWGPTFELLFIYIAGVIHPLFWVLIVPAAVGGWKNDIRLILKHSRKKNESSNIL